MLAAIEYPTYELLEIARRARDNIHSIEGVLFWVAVPLALLPPIPIRWKSIWIRTIFITLFVWIVLMGFRIAYEVPWNRMVMDIEKRDFEYDGCGGNAALLMIGWTFPFFQCIITLCLTRFILVRIGNRRKKSAEVVDERSATTGEKADAKDPK